MNLEILLDEQSESYAETKRAIITQRLTTALLLLLQELEASDLKYTSFIGKGISGDASIETANKFEQLAADHAAKFGASEAELIADIDRNRKLGTMVLPKEH
jgi:hypothetical protein